MEGKGSIETSTNIEMSLTYSSESSIKRETGVSQMFSFSQERTVQTVTDYSKGNYLFTNLKKDPFMTTFTSSKQSECEQFFRRMKRNSLSLPDVSDISDITKHYESTINRGANLKLIFRPPTPFKSTAENWTFSDSECETFSASVLELCNVKERRTKEKMTRKTSAPERLNMLETESKVITTSKLKPESRKKSRTINREKNEKLEARPPTPHVEGFPWEFLAKGSPRLKRLREKSKQNGRCNIESDFSINTTQHKITRSANQSF